MSYYPNYYNYDFQDGKSVLKGYRVEHLFEITIRNLQQAGEIYDAAVEAGANIAGNLDFQVSNYGAYYQQALQAAIKNAQEKAKSISAQLGVPLNPIPVKITEEHSPVAPEFKVAYATALTVQANTPIQSRDIDVKASVIAVFHYQ